MPKLFPSYRKEIRKKIINEAITVFLEKGFDNTTLDEIASRLDVTKPALYRYFKSKDDLFMSSVVESTLTEYQIFQTILFNGDDIMTSANSFFDAILEFIRKHENIMMDIFAAMKRNKSYQEIHPDFHERFIQMMQTGFEEKIQKGLIHPDFDSRILAIICSSFIGGLIHFVIEESDTQEAKEAWLKGFAKLVGLKER